MMHSFRQKSLCTLWFSMDLIIYVFRANMSLPKGKTKKTKDYNMKAFYKFEETTNMENLQMKVSSYGAV